MKISFDFDNTLDKPVLQEIAREFINQGHEVWITSSRSLRGNQTKVIHKDLFDVAMQLGIDKNVQLTNHEHKFNYLHGFNLHFDDNKLEVDLINLSQTGCLAFHYGTTKNIKKLI